MKDWANAALKQMREIGAPVRLVADLRGPVFDVQPGDVLELSPIAGHSSFYPEKGDWRDTASWKSTLVVVRWLDGRVRLAIVTTRKGPHNLGTRLHFTDSRGRDAWIGPRHQFAVARVVTDAVSEIESCAK